MYVLDLRDWCYGHLLSYWLVRQYAPTVRTHCWHIIDVVVTFIYPSLVLRKRLLRDWCYGHLLSYWLVRQYAPTVRTHCWHIIDVVVTFIYPSLV